MRGAALESRAVDPGTMVTHAWRREESPLPRAPQPHALVVPGTKRAGLPPTGDSPPNPSHEGSSVQASGSELSGPVVLGSGPVCEGEADPVERGRQRRAHVAGQ